MKQKHRYRRKKKGAGLLEAWPANVTATDLVARVSYVGSPEHKARPLHLSYNFEPALRSDASRCDPTIERDVAQAALQDALLRMSVSQEFDGDFPRYVWGSVNGQPHIARLINSYLGQYKGWPIGSEELPAERNGQSDGNGEEGEDA